MDLMIALLWVHPLAWLLRSQWREEIEHQADRAALGQIEADEYASDLLRLVRTGHAPPPPIGVAFAHSSSSNRFRRRLLRLFEPPNESKRCGTIACIAAALLFAFTLLALSCHIRPDSAPEMTVEAQRRLNANPFPADF
jgi:beta-lactamase regulating signal transducer with metallopeptidase domain